MTDGFYAQEKATCPLCGGTGWLDVTTQNLYPTDRACRCTLRHLFRTKVGAELYNAPKLDFSIFEKKLKTNCYIEANLPDFKPHIRRALLVAGLDHFHREASDQVILDAWLGKEKAVSREQSQSSMDFTSLRDLSEDPHLLIIHLGTMVYSNRALASVIQEAINIRLFQGKPTWLHAPYHYGIDNESTIYYSPTLVDLVAENFEKFTLKPDATRTPLSEGLVDAGAEDALNDVVDDFFG